MGLVETLRAAGCVWAEEEAELLSGAASSPAELERFVARRAAGEPLEHVVGWAMFDGSRVPVRRGVFVPRRRTELLVESALEDASGRHSLTVVDLCCGSGALGLAFVRRWAGAVELHAADLMPDAVANARENIGDLGQVHQGDLFDALPDRLRGQVDVLLANTPYVPTDEIALLPGEARDHEPLETLDGGSDGLDIARRVADAAGDWLAPDGRLYVEASDHQAPVLAAHMERTGLAATVREDVVIGHLVRGP